MNKRSAKARGSSMVEFIVVAPVLLGLGLGTVQAALVYHGNSIVNYATFEAARTGAVNNALRGPMMSELATRLAPLQGGDGTAEKAAEAIAKSRLETTLLQNKLTRIEILNPTLEAFEHFKVSSRESGVEVIPNSHLRHQSTTEIDPVSGVNIQDANLLKIRVTHGFELEVPGVRRLLTSVMSVLDADNAEYYLAGKLPLVSVATVRMQSEVHGDFLRSATAPAAAQVSAHGGLPDDQTQVTALAPDTTSVDEATTEGGDGDDSAHNPGLCGPGLGSDPFLPVASNDGVCAVGHSVEPSSPTVPSEGEQPSAITC